MSMEHKAYVFDTGLYHKEMELVIKKCCRSKNIRAAEEYIEKNYMLLKMPDSGENLEENWREECNMGLQGMFDILLTRCYDPGENIGLDYAWDGVLAAVRSMKIMGNADLCVLGKLLVYSRVTVDPGCEGLGIVEAGEAVQIQELLVKNREKIGDVQIEDEELLYELTPAELSDAYENLCMIYQKAVEEGKGILFTF